MKSVIWGRMITSGSGDCTERWSKRSKLSYQHSTGLPWHLWERLLCHKSVGAAATFLDRGPPSADGRGVPRVWSHKARLMSTVDTSITCKNSVSHGEESFFLWRTSYLPGKPVARGIIKDCDALEVFAQRRIVQTIWKFISEKLDGKASYLLFIDFPQETIKTCHGVEEIIMNLECNFDDNDN